MKLLFLLGALFAVIAAYPGYDRQTDAVYFGQPGHNRAYDIFDIGRHGGRYGSHSNEYVLRDRPHVPAYNGPSNDYAAPSPYGAAQNQPSGY